MKHFRPRRTAALAGSLGLAIAAAAVLSQPASGSLRPTGDIVERFAADPRQDSRWFASGTWSWDQGSTTLAFDGSGAGTFVWNPGSHFTGTLSLRLRLLAGGAGTNPSGRLIFAFDPATGAHRWLDVAAGSPGRLTLGQTGTIRGSAPGVLQSWRAPVAAGAWLDLALRIAPDKSVTVSLAGRNLFTAAAAPLAPGKVGFAAAAGAVEFDEFSFAADPDGEPCFECHAGQPGQPLARDVYSWWDGRRFDALRGTDPVHQQGGHGDPGGAAAVGCTGANSCHDMKLPRPEDHRNGTREGRGQRSVNSFHLRSEAIVAAPLGPSSAQSTFDVAFCTQKCHTAEHIESDLHASRVGLREDGESLTLPVDSDITTRALTTAPDFIVCVSCHDPHGTGIVGRGSRNIMVRMEFMEGDENNLCRQCKH